MRSSEIIWQDSRISGDQFRWSDAELRRICSDRKLNTQNRSRYLYPLIEDKLSRIKHLSRSFRGKINSYNFIIFRGRRFQKTRQTIKMIGILFCEMMITYWLLFSSARQHALQQTQVQYLSRRQCFSAFTFLASQVRARAGFKYWYDEPLGMGHKLKTSKLNAITIGDKYWPNKKEWGRNKFLTGKSSRWVLQRHFLASRQLPKHFCGDLCFRISLYLSFNYSVI